MTLRCIFENWRTTNSAAKAKSVDLLFCLTPRRAACALLMLACAPILAHAAGAPSYTTDIAPLFANRCAGCHAASVHMGGLTIDSYAGVMKGSAHGAVIVPGKSDTSRLFLLITAKMQPAMPMDGTKLSDGDIALIKSWIDAGAPGPKPGEAVAAAPAANIPHIEPKVPAKHSIFDLAFSPDGKTIALAGFREARLIDATTKQTIATIPAVDKVRAVAFSRDGKLLAVAGGLAARKGEVVIWDVDAKKVLRTITGHADCIYAVAFSPDGKSIATSSYDKLIKLWDVNTGSEIRTLKDHIDAVFALAFTPDGKHIISGSADRSVKVWDPATGQRLYTLSDPQDGINTIAIDPTGKYVAAGGLDKTIRIWEIGEKEATLQASLIAHEDAILRLAWSPDGKTLISSSADGTIKILRASDLTELKSIPGQSDWVYGLQFEPDGKKFAAGRFDGTLTFYDVTPTANQLASK
ncbi:MAG TPA: c-type cytochrome domain-containing protein [Bryobacteraceae bacterium]|nr:c-type cytochrome domain-containing protein [Bryobacteraceae bacterium]